MHIELDTSLLPYAYPYPECSLDALQHHAHKKNSKELYFRPNFSCLSLPSLKEFLANLGVFVKNQRGPALEALFNLPFLQPRQSVPLACRGETRNTSRCSACRHCLMCPSFVDVALSSHGPCQRCGFLRSAMISTVQTERHPAPPRRWHPDSERTASG
eukprot:1990173-Prymnesium_polylepis.1